MSILIQQAKRGMLVMASGCLLWGGAVFGQVEQSPAPISSSSALSSASLQTYQQGRVALAQEEAALTAKGATPAQVDAWHQQNASLFNAQQQQAQAMAAASASQAAPIILQPNIPANASPTLRDFLATQAALANARAQIHNQLMQSIPSTATDTQMNQLQQQELQLFQQQQGANLQLQAQRAQILMQESAQVAVPMPPPLQLPPNATPQMTVYLTLRDQLMREEVQMSNQYLSVDPQVKAAALQQWRQVNVARFTQLQQLARNLSRSPAN